MHAYETITENVKRKDTTDVIKNAMLKKAGKNCQSIKKSMEGEAGTKRGKQKKTQKVIIFYSINCSLQLFVLLLAMMMQS